MSATENTPNFSELGLSQPVLSALQETGYERPSPIQAASIPPLLEGRDILGQAQTGTGKTAAFSLPILSRLDASEKGLQVLVLAPTRELALQVAESCQRYSTKMAGFEVLPIYGGSSYDSQIRALKRGAQMVVGTPGRVMDLMRRGKMDLSNIKSIVLDEADEMLRMGFIDDVEWILEQAPEKRQVALFSATMPSVIRKIAHRHLNDPAEVRIAAKTAAANTVTQRYWQVNPHNKTDALIRLLEVERFEALLVFARTKTATEEISSKLAARGFSCEALHGDIPQKLRERTVDKLRQGQLDILIATDVVARGLDVERITHVVNFDIPYDTESYVHRIGRTGRAGRKGDAILFVTSRERRMLKTIERATCQTIEPMKIPTVKDVNQQRLSKFKEKIQTALQAQKLEDYQNLINDFMETESADPVQIAAALACLYHGDRNLLLDESKPDPLLNAGRDRDGRDRDSRERRGERGGRDRDDRRGRRDFPTAGARSLRDHPDVDMQRYRVAVGRRDGVNPGQIVGAIANEAGIESRYIGHIEICDSFSTVDLPGNMPNNTMSILKKARVCQRPMDIRLYTDTPPSRSGGYDKSRGGYDRKRSNRSGGGRERRSFN